MEIKTFDTILAEICDFFDSLISPKQLSRSNTNIIYLIFKAIAKGLEIINNVCVVLSNKFDPYSCSEEDLESVAKIVGTAKLEGAVSGLRIVAYNTNSQSVILPAGVYTYSLDSDTVFSCEITADTSIPAHEYAEFMFLTEKFGSFPVTEQQTVVIESEETIPSGITFSCSANTTLLGYTPETNLEFRKRITSDTNRQDTINELKVKLRNLPYVYDCEIIFNRNTSTIYYVSFTIEPYYMLIMLSCAVYKEEIAKIVAESSIYPTVNVPESSKRIDYKNGAFVSSDGEYGVYPVYVNDFEDKEFTATVTYSYDSSYISSSSAQDKMRSGLFTAINTNVHKDAITSADLFDALESLNITGVKIYGVQLFVNNTEQAYIDCLKTEIGKLTDVTFSSVLI